MISSPSDAIPFASPLSPYALELKTWVDTQVDARISTAHRDTLVSKSSGHSLDSSLIESFKSSQVRLLASVQDLSNQVAQMQHRVESEVIGIRRMESGDR